MPDCPDDVVYVPSLRRCVLANTRLRCWRCGVTAEARQIGGCLVDDCEDEAWELVAGASLRADNDH